MMLLLMTARWVPPGEDVLRELKSEFFWTFSKSYSVIDLSYVIFSMGDLVGNDFRSREKTLRPIVRFLRGRRRLTAGLFFQRLSGWGKPSKLIRKLRYLSAFNSLSTFNRWRCWYLSMSFIFWVKGWLSGDLTRVRPNSLSLFFALRE